jgi:hypothetical protein
MKPLGTTISQIEMADNADIRRAITKATPKARMQAKKFAHRFKRATDEQTCKAIFDYLKNNIKYVADEDHQIVQLPSALMRNKVGDCKSYSVFTSAVLSNLGIPHHYMYASYTNNPTPGHIYVVTDSGIIIDAVYGTFNAEKTANYKYPTNINGTMRVSTITGLGACCASCESGVGFLKRDPKKKAAKDLEKEEKKRLKELEKTLKDQARDACGAQGLKPGTLALGRWLFAALVQMNMDGFATKMSKMDFAKIKDAWCKVGGNPFSLQEWIKNGSQRKEIRIGFFSRLLKKAGVKIGSAGIGSEGLTPQKIKLIENAIPATGALIATPIALASGNPEKAVPAVPPFVAVLKALAPLIIDMVRSLSGKDMGPDEQIPPFNPGTPPPNPGSGMNTNTILLIAGGLAAAYFVFKK